MTGDGGKRFEEASPELVLPAFRVALRILGDVAEAEDVAAEALARTLRAVGSSAAPPVPQGLGGQGGVEPGGGLRPAPPASSRRRRPRPRPTSPVTTGDPIVTMPDAATTTTTAGGAPTVASTLAPPRVAPPATTPTTSPTMAAPATTVPSTTSTSLACRNS